MSVSPECMSPALHAACTWNHCDCRCHEESMLPDEVEFYEDMELFDPDDNRWRWPEDRR